MRSKRFFRSSRDKTVLTKYFSVMLQGSALSSMLVLDGGCVVVVGAGVVSITRVVLGA